MRHGQASGSRRWIVQSCRYDMHVFPAQVTRRWCREDAVPKLQSWSCRFLSPSSRLGHDRLQRRTHLDAAWSRLRADCVPRQHVLCVLCA